MKHQIIFLKYRDDVQSKAEEKKRIRLNGKKKKKNKGREINGQRNKRTKVYDREKKRKIRKKRLEGRQDMWVDGKK